MTIILIVGGAGSGKTTFLNRLKEKGTTEVISHTTRPPRKDEVDGVDYHFVDNLKNINFVEYINHGGYEYGVSVEAFLNEVNNININSTGIIAEPQGILQILRWISINLSKIKRKIKIQVVHLNISKELRHQRLYREVYDYNLLKNDKEVNEIAINRLNRNDDFIDSLFKSKEYKIELFHLFERLSYAINNISILEIAPDTTYLEECDAIVNLNLKNLFGV